MEAGSPAETRAQRSCWLLVVALSCFRFAHLNLLWSDEDYHIAAALQILRGKLPYRDFWYDKPPLNAAYYLAIGAFPGWPLRLLDAGYVVLLCYLVYRIARQWWGPAEGRAAALLCAFFMTFYLPSAVISFAADALMMAPHLAAIYYALRRKALIAGLWAGIAFWVNPKALFVLAVCALWLALDLRRAPSIVRLCAGFALPLAAGFSAALLSGAWPGYIEQVWRWGLLYATGSPTLHPLAFGSLRTLHWLGFHAALAVGTVAAFLRLRRHDRWKLIVWLGFSFAAVCLGSRFDPRYFLQLLSPLVVAASRGIVLAFREQRKPALVVLTLLLLIPFARFAPRYAALAADDISHREPHWADVALDLDSWQAARQICSAARAGDTLFVWGYRSDLYVYTRMISDSRFWDSQPLTGVPADRHLSVSAPIYGGPAAANRLALTQSRPVWIVDGLGLLNPNLAPSAYPELRPWLAKYKLVDRTKLSLIYRRIE